MLVLGHRFSKQKGRKSRPVLDRQRFSRQIRTKSGLRNIRQLAEMMSAYMVKLDEDEQHRPKSSTNGMEDPETRGQSMFDFSGADADASVEALQSFRGLRNPALALQQGMEEFPGTCQIPDRTGNLVSALVDTLRASWRWLR